MPHPDYYLHDRGKEVSPISWSQMKTVPCHPITGHLPFNTAPWGAWTEGPMQWAESIWKCMHQWQKELFSERPAACPSWLEQPVWKPRDGQTQESEVGAATGSGTAVPPRTVSEPPASQCGDIICGKKQVSNKSHINFCVGMAEGRSRPVKSAVPIPGGVQQTTGHSTYCCGQLTR